MNIFMKKITSVYKKRANSRGQSLVELALVLALLLFMVIAIIEYGFMLNNYLNILDAGREAARAGSLIDPFRPPPASPGQVDQKERVTAEMPVARLDRHQHRCTGDRGVDGVAATIQDVHCRLAWERVRRCGHTFTGQRHVARWTCLRLCLRLLSCHCHVLFASFLRCDRQLIYRLSAKYLICWSDRANVEQVGVSWLIERGQTADEEDVMPLVGVSRLQ